MIVRMNLKTQGKRLLALGLCAGLAALAGCPSQSGTQAPATMPAPTATNPPAVSPGMQGSVYGGRQPIAGATVLAYEMSTVNDTVATQIGSTTTDSSGNFTLAFSPTPANGEIVYLVADGGNAGSGVNSAISLMTVAGPYCSGTGCAFPASVNIDELSTVVSTAAMDLYLDLVSCPLITGNTQPSGDICVDLQGDNTVSPLFARQVAALVNLTSGQASGFLTAQATSSPIHLTLEKANSLADILAACVNTSGPSSTACTGLFGATLNNASDTLTAAYDIATSPVINTKGTVLFSLLPSTPVYAPVVTAAPANWTVAGQVYSYAANYGSGTTGGFVSAWQASHDAGVSLLPITTGGAGSCGVTPDPGNCFAAGVGPNSMAIAPGGEFVYALNAKGNDISAWAADPATGVLVPVTAGAVSCGSGLPSNCFVTGNGPFWMAMNAAGTDLYVTNGTDNTISVFSVDSSTGALAPISGSPFEAGNEPTVITLDEGGHFAYVSNYDGNDVSAYTVNPANGALTPVTAGAGPCHNPSPHPDPGNCFAAGSGPYGVVVDSNGNYLYVANYNYCVSSCTTPGNISAYTINTGSGALTDVSGSSCGAGLASNCFEAADDSNQITVDSSGAFLYASGYDCTTGSGCTSSYISAYSISTGGALAPVTTGAGPCGAANSLNNCFATVFGPADLVAAPHTLVVANSGNVVSTYNIDETSGALSQTSIGDQYNADLNSSGISIDSTGRYAFVSNGSGVIDGYILDPLTGALRLNATISSSNAVGGNLAMDPSGRYLYSPGGGGGNQVAAFYIGPADGNLNLVPGGACGSGNSNNNCFPAGPYPEKVSVDTSGQFLYAANSNCATGLCSNQGSVSAYTIASTSGALTAVTTGGAASCGVSPDPMNCFAAGEATFSVATDPAAGLLYATNANSNNISAFTVNSSTGALTGVAGSACGTGPSNCFAAGVPLSSVFTPGGQFAYATNYGANSISVFSVNLSTGVLTPVDGTASCGGALPSICFEAGNQPFASAMTPNGAYYYVVNNSGNDVSAYSVNSGTGVLTPVTTGGAGTCGVTPDPDNCFAAGTQAHAVSVDPTGHYVYVTNRNCSPSPCSVDGYVLVYTLNSSTGALTPLSISSPFAAGSEPFAIVFGP